MKIRRSIHMKFIGALLLSVMALLAEAQVPVIQTVQPDAAYSGQTISITGTDFSAGAIVTFGAVRGNVISVTDQLIEVEVPVGATHDFITVTNPGTNQTGYSRLKFLPAFGGVPDFRLRTFLPKPIYRFRVVYLIFVYATLTAISNRTL